MFTETSIKFRLLFVTSILTVLMIGIGVLGLYGFNHSNEGLRSVYEDRTVPSVQLGTILDTWYRIRLNAMDSVIKKDVNNAQVKLEETLKLVKENEGIWAKVS